MKRRKRTLVIQSNRDRFNEQPEASIRSLHTFIRATWPTFKMNYRQKTILNQLQNDLSLKEIKDLVEALAQDPNRPNFFNFALIRGKRGE